MGSVEFLIVLAVAALDLAIVAWRVRTDELVLNAKLRQGFLKKGLLFCGGGIQPIGGLGAVVGLDVFNEIGDVSAHTKSGLACTGLFVLSYS